MLYNRRTGMCMLATPSLPNGGSRIAAHVAGPRAMAHATMRQVLDADGVAEHLELCVLMRAEERRTALLLCTVPYEYDPTHTTAPIEWTQDALQISAHVGLERLAAALGRRIDDSDESLCELRNLVYEGAQLAIFDFLAATPALANVTCYPVYNHHQMSFALGWTVPADAEEAV